MEESKKARRKHWSECPVSGDALEKPTEAIEANGTVECEKMGKPRAFWKARQDGRGGLGRHFKGT